MEGENEKEVSCFYVNYLWHMTYCKHGYDDGHNFQRPLFLVSSWNSSDYRSAYNDEDNKRYNHHDDRGPEEAVVFDVGGVAA